MITGIDIRTGIQQSLDGLYGISMLQRIMQNRIPILIFLIDVSIMPKDESSFFHRFSFTESEEGIVSLIFHLSITFMG